MNYEIIHKKKKDKMNYDDNMYSCMLGVTYYCSSASHWSCTN